MSSLDLYVSKTHFYVRSDKFVTQGLETIIIDRSNTQMQVVNNDLKLDAEKEKVHVCAIYGIVGIMNVLGTNFLVVIQDVEDVGTLNNSTVFKVTKTKFISFTDGTKVPLTGQAIETLNATKLMLEDGFYFSYGCDVTCSRQRRAKFIEQSEILNKVSQPADDQSYQAQLSQLAFDRDYFWNEGLYTDFIQNRIKPKWFTPLMNGYFGQEVGQIGEHKIQINLITRRMHHKSGSQKINRGINDEGFVANQCETEQILMIDDKQLFSHVQIRGSVPVYWEQKGLNEAIKITRSPGLTKAAFRAHMTNIIDTYGDLVIINLLRYMRKGKEMIITTEFVRQYLESELQDQIKYINFDFHGYCSKDRYHNLKVMVQKCEEDLHKHGWFTQNLISQSVMQSQQGVIRTNCLDSLDRTNVAQSKIGMVALQLQLQQAGVNLNQTYGEEMSKDGVAFIISKDQNDILQKFRSMWTIMGDYLSRQYAGTDSTISRVSRDGKEGFIGGLDHKAKVAQRFMINVMQDNPMQNTIDVILGKHLQTGTISSQQAYINECLKQLQYQYSNIDYCKLVQGSWNLNGGTLKKDDFQDWLETMKGMQDIYLLGFQNMQQGGIFTSQAKMIQKVVDPVMDAFNHLKYNEYSVIRQQDYYGQLSLLVVKKSLISKIKDIFSCQVSTGMIYTGVASCIRFAIEDTTLCFGNVNVSQTMASEILTELKENAFKQDRDMRYQKYEFKNHKIQVLAGELGAAQIDLANFEHQLDAKLMYSFDNYDNQDSQFLALEDSAVKKYEAQGQTAHMNLLKVMVVQEDAKAKKTFVEVLKQRYNYIQATKSNASGTRTIRIESDTLKFSEQNVQHETEERRQRLNPGCQPSLGDVGCLDKHEDLDMLHDVVPQQILDQLNFEEAGLTLGPQQLEQKIKEFAIWMEKDEMKHQTDAYVAPQCQRRIAESSDATPDLTPLEEQIRHKAAGFDPVKPSGTVSLSKGDSLSIEPEQF